MTEKKAEKASKKAKKHDKENAQVEEEADESCYWLELIIEGEILPEGQVASLLAS